MDEANLKPNNQEKAVWVMEMMDTPGWKIIAPWLTEQLQNCRNALEESKDDTRYWQGSINAYKAMFLKLKGYSDNVAKTSNK